jgi:RNA polymerase sigma-70 factor (ECF subfamily)
METSNATWIEALKGPERRQREALEELRGILLRTLRQALRGYAGVHEAFLEDMVQEALLRILDRLEQFEGRSRFLTWATAIAIRTALGELRRRRYKDRSLDEILAQPGAFLPEPLAEEATAPKATERRVLVDSMYRIIQSDLTERQRKALLAELEGVPQGEIALHLGSNRNAVYKLTHDARRRLKDGLEAAGFRSADIHATFGP